MADAIQMIKQDHREVEHMFAEFRSSGDREIALRICEELEVHTTLEEELVYPILAEIDAELEKEGEKEHDEADSLIKKVKQHDGDLRSLMQELEASVKHHVEEEESQSLPKLEMQATDQIAAISAEFERRKQELKQRTNGGGTSKQQLLDLTKEELYEKAKEAGIPGRSDMKKEQLAEELAKRG